MSIVVNPSKTSTLWSSSTHVAVFHHITRGELVQMSWSKMDAPIGSDEGKEGENEQNLLHVWGCLGDV